MLQYLHLPSVRCTALGLALLLAGGSGCSPAVMNHYIKVVHPKHEHEHHAAYYHCPYTGRIIIKHPHQCEVYPEPAFYGFEATCWRRWPQGWVGCPEEIIEEVIDVPVEGCQNGLVPQPLAPTYADPQPVPPPINDGAQHENPVYQPAPREISSRAISSLPLRKLPAVENERRVSQSVEAAPNIATVPPVATKPAENAAATQPMISTAPKLETTVTAIAKPTVAAPSVAVSEQPAAVTPVRSEVAAPSIESSGMSAAEPALVSGSSVNKDSLIAPAPAVTQSSLQANSPVVEATPKVVKPVVTTPRPVALQASQQRPTVSSAPAIPATTVLPQNAIPSVRFLNSAAGSQASQTVSPTGQAGVVAVRMRVVEDAPELSVRTPSAETVGLSEETQPAVRFRSAGDSSQEIETARPLSAESSGTSSPEPRQAALLPVRIRKASY